MKVNPFTFIRLTTKKKKRTPLTQYELNKLAVKQFNTDRLTVVRDIFLFACYTGMAYADVTSPKRFTWQMNPQKRNMAT